MDSETVEVRAIARGAAVLIAVIGGTLLTTVSVSPTIAPGVGAAPSVQVIRKKPQPGEPGAPAPVGPALTDALAGGRGEAGFGEEIRLWFDGPGGELVFRSAERFERCLLARNMGMEAPDCPSAADRRRMVLDRLGDIARGA